MVYQLGSGFIAARGILQVFASFFEANLIYRYAWPSEEFWLSLLHPLLRVVALHHHGHRSRRHLCVHRPLVEKPSHHEYSTIAHRMGHVFGHAGKAMSVNFISHHDGLLLRQPVERVHRRQTFGIFSRVARHLQLYTGGVTDSYMGSKRANRADALDERSTTSAT